MLVASPARWRKATITVLGRVSSSSSGRASIARPACWASSRHWSIISPRRRRPTRAQRDQDLQRVEAAGGVERAADEVELALGLVLGAVEVDAGVVDGAQDVHVRDEQRAGAERLPPQLVQVGGDAVRALDALQARPLALREHEAGADRGVDVEPRAALLRPVGERLERVDRAEVGRARGADERDHVLTFDRRVERRAATSRRCGRWGRRSRPRCRARAARPSGGCVVRGGLGHDPPVVWAARRPARRSRPPGRAPAAARAGSRPSRPSSSRRSRRRRARARAPASAPARPPRRSRPARRRRRPSTGWSRRRPARPRRRRSAARDAGARPCADPRAGSRRPGSGRRPRAPARAARPRAGTGRARRRRPSAARW